MLMRTRKSADALLELPGEWHGGRISAGRQRCQAADDREDVLDAVRQLPCQQLACFLGLLSLVNVEGDADPLDDLAVRVMDGARADDEPAIFPVAGPPEGDLDLEGRE